MSDDKRYTFLKEFIKNESAIDELLLYTENKFSLKNKPSLPLKEEPYLAIWETYVQEAKQQGAFETLKKYLVQLQFPIQKGISKTEAYKHVTLRGKPKQSDLKLALEQPELIKLDLYKNSMVGKVPIIIVPNNNDFNAIVCAISNKNEPAELPQSMGAIFINGINNWDRIHRLKFNWLKQHPNGNWNNEFKEHILPKTELYKDKLIVLSTKDYSGINNKVLNILETTWKSSSLIIRREHECAHLFTSKYYGHMANNMHDEIIADYAGITKILGQFNKHWFLHFIGLENYPNYRKGGRLENYLGKNKLSKDAFEGLKIIIKNATDNVFEFDQALGNIKAPQDHLQRIKTLCEVDLISMALPKGFETLTNKYNSLNVLIPT